MNRRNFITNSTFAGLGLMSLPFIPELKEKIKTMEHLLPEDLVILFQGDSVTDTGRHRGAYYANNPAGMGQGYAFIVASMLLAQNAKKNLKFYNRGISGHKVF